jgi:hypothetical protein
MTYVETQKIGDASNASAVAAVTGGNPTPNAFGLVTRNVDMSFDAFNRLRVSEPYNQFAGFNEYKINPFNYVTAISGTGTATHSTATKNVTLSTGGTASGARAVLQSRLYFRYVPGKSLYPMMTFVMGSIPPTNCAKRAMYGDDNNGVGLEWTSTGVRFIKRSNTTGSVVTTTVEQAAWSVDTLDGSGPSGLTLDLTKGQIFWMDLQFLGMGTVRFGFEINGVPYLCHTMHHANLTAVQPYIATANLPVRWEIVNTGVASASASMECCCAKVDSEGGFEVPGIQYTASRGAAGLSTTTTLTPLISIRPGPTFNGIVNRGWVVPQTARLVTVGTSTHYWELIWNATLTGPSWTAVNANAMGQYDVTASAVSLGSGVVVDSGYISPASGAGTAAGSYFAGRPLVNSFDGTTPDTLTLAVRTISGTDDAYGSISWLGYW